MNHPNWSRPLLGAALLSVMTISGCGNGSNATGGLQGFVSLNGGQIVTSAAGNGTATSEAPYLEVLNQTTMAEYSLNATTGTLTPVDFNLNSATGSQNTIQLSGTPGPVAQITVSANATTGDVQSAIFVGIGTSIECFLVDDVTGNISQFLNPANGQPLVLTAGGSVVSLDAVPVISANTTTTGQEVPVLYAAENNSSIEAWEVETSPSLTVVPLTFPDGSNSISTGITNPVQLTDTLTNEGLPFLYVLNQGSGTGSIGAFTIASGSSGTVPGELTALGTPAAGNGLTLASSFAVFTQPVLGLVATSQNDALSTFTITTTGSTEGEMTASGNTIGSNVNVPTSVSTIGPAFFVTSSQGGTGSVESFEIQETGNNPDQLTIVAGGNGATNSVTTGIDLPASALTVENGLDFFVYVANTQGTGTGGVAVFTLDTTNLVLDAANVQNGNTTNVQSFGITQPPINPQDMVVVTGP